MLRFALKQLTSASISRMSGLVTTTQPDGGIAAVKSVVEESVSSPIEGHDQTEAGVKRSSEDTDEVAAKKLKSADSSVLSRAERRPQPKRKKFAILMVYSGKDYQGMQRNPGVKSIEEDLLVALEKAGVVAAEHIASPGQMMDFQRAARTDKGVSAAGQVVSLKMFMDVEKAVDKINTHLQPQIRVLGLKQVTKGFNSKNACSARTYLYTLPTFAFAPVEEVVTQNYRVTSDILKKVNEVLSLFKGTHNFHNFTSGKKPNDASARRYIMDFRCSDAYEQEGLELAEITVKGQSFMLHQIRKMIGITIAIVRGFVGTEVIERAWQAEKCDVPKAPGLGLVLDKVHYDFYNKRYGNDGMHEALDWEIYAKEIEQFKRDHINPTIINTEKEEKSMLEWMSTLPLHHFGVCDPDKGSPFSETPLGQTFLRINKERKEKEQAAENTEKNEVSEPSAQCGQEQDCKQMEQQPQPEAKNAADTTEKLQDSSAEVQSDEITSGSSPS